MKPVAVLISDVHYNINTLKLADAAMRMAIDKANSLNVPLVVAGDLHDTKANLRGECVNAMVNTFKLCSEKPYLLVGNHDRINEKAFEHSLNFLEPYAQIYGRTYWCEDLDIGFFAYNHDPDDLRKHLKLVDKGSTLIMHQGLTSSNMGDYIQDKSAINPEDVAGFRVISGHYHQRQTIKLPSGGKWNYIGNPYTTSWGEANDPPKGFQILMSDGSLEFVPTNLRKHVVIEMDGTKGIPHNYNPGDLIWVKVKDTYENLKVYNRTVIGKMLNLEGQPFKLDLIAINPETVYRNNNLTQGPLLDSLIDSQTNTTDEKKARLKGLWKSLCE